jgi:hypothetical protein
VGFAPLALSEILLLQLALLTSYQFQPHTVT